jgi:hypothetical protein
MSTWRERESLFSRLSAGKRQKYFLIFFRGEFAERLGGGWRRVLLDEPDPSAKCKKAGRWARP